MLVTSQARFSSLPLVVPAVVCTIATGVLFAVGWGGWPGVVGSSGTEFCEALRPGMIKQPANTWSNLAFIFAGLAAGWLAGDDLRRSAGANRMRSLWLYPTLYAVSAALVGPLSMALHASATIWGGRIDILSMFGWAAFILMYALVRRFELSTQRFLAGYVGLTLLLTTLFLTRILPVSGSFWFGCVLFAYGAVEFSIYRKRQDLRSDRIWLAGTAALFSVALTVWYLSRTGNPWCDPDSLLQGHALWHILNGTAMFTLYRFFRSEEAAAIRTS